MDKNVEELVKRVIRQDLGDIVAREIELRFKPIQATIQTILNGQDGIVKQLHDDRSDINKNTVDIATIAKQAKIIIRNQDIQEEKVVKAVEDEAKKLNGTIEKSVEKMFTEKSFLKKLTNKFMKGR